MSQRCVTVQCTHALNCIVSTTFQRGNSKDGKPCVIVRVEESARKETFKLLGVPKYSAHKTIAVTVTVTVTLTVTVTVTRH
jgi:hypothetical protein